MDALACHAERLGDRADAFTGLIPGQHFEGSFCRSCMPTHRS
jgi:hypothetical protein